MTLFLDDLSTINKTFKSLIDSHQMNHIEYQVFNSIQDPAAKKIEEHYSFLQGKVADAVIFYQLQNAFLRISIISTLTTVATQKQ